MGKEMEEWWTRHLRDKKKDKGDLGAEAVRENEVGEKLESFFCTAHEFLTDYAKPSNPPVPTVIPVNAFAPVVLPAQFIPVDFVPASSPNHCITNRLLRPMTSIRRPEASNTRAPS